MRGQPKFAVLNLMVFFPLIIVIHFARLYLKMKKNNQEVLESKYDLQQKYLYLMVISLLMVVIFIGVAIVIW